MVPKIEYSLHLPMQLRPKLWESVNSLGDLEFNGCYSEIKGKYHYLPLQSIQISTKEMECNRNSTQKIECNANERQLSFPTVCQLLSLIILGHLLYAKTVVLCCIEILLPLEIISKGSLNYIGACRVCLIVFVLSYSLCCQPSNFCQIALINDHFS